MTGGYEAQFTLMLCLADKLSNDETIINDLEKVVAPRPWPPRTTNSDPDLILIQTLFGP